MGERKEKKLKIITDRAAMMYTPVACILLASKGKEKLGHCYIPTADTNSLRYISAHSECADTDTYQCGLDL
jgi:hypothetical protein